MVWLSNSWYFSRSSCKLLNGSSSLFSAACWFDWLMLDLLKQLTMVSFDRHSMMIQSVSFFGEYKSLEAICCSPPLRYKDERLSFGNGVWGFVLHPGPLVEEYTLYLEENSCHPTFFLRSVSAGKMFYIFKAPWLFGRANHKHFQLFPNCTSGRHDHQSYFTVLASRALFSRCVVNFGW